MSDHDDGKLPARSRKAVDPAAEAERQQSSAVDASQLRHLHAAIEASEDDETT